MKKDWNSISPNMTLQGIMWRLGSFFSLLLIFISTSLFASENPSSETFVHASPVVEEPVQEDQPENTPVYVTEGTVVYGLENLHIASAETKKIHSQPKNLKKIPFEKKLHTKKAENKTSTPKQTPKPVYSFRNNTKSETYFLYSSVLRVYAFGGTSFSFKFIAANEMKILSVLLLITGVFLINFYKSRSFSGYYFSQNFQRPPPELIL